MRILPKLPVEYVFMTFGSVEIPVDVHFCVLGKQSFNKFGTKDRCVCQKCGGANYSRIIVYWLVVVCYLGTLIGAYHHLMIIWWIRLWHLFSDHCTWIFLSCFVSLVWPKIVLQWVLGMLCLFFLILGLFLSDLWVFVI